MAAILHRRRGEVAGDPVDDADRVRRFATTIAGDAVDGDRVGGDRGDDHGQRFAGGDVGPDSRRIADERSVAGLQPQAQRRGDDGERAATIHDDFSVSQYVACTAAKATARKMAMFQSGHWTLKIKLIEAVTATYTSTTIAAAGTIRHMTSVDVCAG